MSGTLKGRLGVALIIIAAVAFVAYGIMLAVEPAPGLIQGMIDSDEIRVAAKAGGRVEALLATEGDTVAAGQSLFTLTNRELEARLVEMHALRGVAEAMDTKAQRGSRREDIDAARSAWQSRQAEANVAATTSGRMVRLHKEGVVTEQKRDEAVALASATAQAASAAKAEYEKALAGTRSEDKEAAAAQVDQAKAAVAAVAALEEELQAVAPIGGQITKRFANIGEVIPPGFPVFSMIDPDDLWVAFNLREDQFSSLKMEQELMGTVPALDSKPVRFKVYFINPQGDFSTWRAIRQSSGYDIKTFEVRARPVEQIDGLRPGMSVLFDWPPRPSGQP